MGLEEIVPAISLIAILILVLPVFLKSNSELMRIIKKIEDNTDNKNLGFFTLFLKIKE